MTGGTLSAAVPAAAATRAAPSAASAFAALMRRDLRVAVRELPFTLVRTLMQPLLFVIVFGYLLPKMGFVQGSYGAAMLPGILAVSLTMSSVQSVALPMVADFGWTREIEDRLLAPIPSGLLVAQKIVAGALQGVLGAAVVLPIARLLMGPIPGLTLSHLGAALVVTVLGALAFSALGLWMGTAISPQHVGLMFSAIIAPMIFFGCAYYPWRGLDAVPVMKYAVLANPLVYVAEGMRGTLTPSMPHMPLAVVSLALLGLLALFSWLGTRSFMRRAFQ
ncbi:ABC-2 type transporter [Gemmatirosa kalamazoonensis]|uniref:Transport permease protein n=1 Tax=Gemmatirosa kalamazoonensis TaxID=861299 RepID=W0RKB2_9BACT|nr:ABC transporter permease [Gemmatirosa kalamazoonensis]AHG91186.1 ABC-2 type transporter [Gemmatirosa kalamazoonensis]